MGGFAVILMFAQLLLSKIALLAGAALLLSKIALGLSIAVSWIFNLIFF